METQKIINAEQVQSLKANETAEGVLMSLALRERNREETDFQQFKNHLIREGVKVVPEDFNQLFVKLQEMGAGSIIHGRKGKSDRFKWHYSLIDIGNMAFDASVVAAKKAPTPITEAKPVEVAPTPKRRRKSKTFNRSAHMKKIWAARRGVKSKRGRPAGSKNKPKQGNDNVIKLLNEVLKQLKKAA